MKTLKKIIFISIVLGMISSLIISCKSDDKQQTGLLTLNILEGKIKIGAHVSVELSLSHPDLISKIVVKKSIEGKEVSSYLKELNVKELSFPYTFTEEIIAGDENGILVYSFMEWMRIIVCGCRRSGFNSGAGADSVIAKI